MGCSLSGDDEYADVDWDNLGFGLTRADYMFVMKCFKDESFQRGQISPYGNIELSPSAGVLNYGQASWNLDMVCLKNLEQF